MEPIFPSPVPAAPPDFGQPNPPDSPRVISAQSAAEFAAANEPTIQMNFPSDVFLDLGTTTVFFHAGVNPVPTSFQNHWWLTANGVIAV
jgi:hypothetical protein